MGYPGSEFIDPQSEFSLPPPTRLQVASSDPLFKALSTVGSAGVKPEHPQI